mgnify:CR=1 FL=1
MKTVLTSICSIGFILLAQTAVGRTATVATFGSEPSAFKMIEPGVLGVAHGTETEVPVQHPDLVSEFNSIQAASPGIAEAAAIEIPSWMRAAPRIEYDLSGQGSCPMAVYQPHPSLKPEQEIRRSRYYGQMATAACKARIPVDLYDALIIQESRYNPSALSAKGASGLSQLMPGTARNLGVWDRWDVRQNLEGGARYLRQQLDKFGNWALALSAYNAGPGNVQKHRGIPPFRETRAYVRTILANVDSSQRNQGRGGDINAPVQSVRLLSFAR